MATGPAKRRLRLAPLLSHTRKRVPGASPGKGGANHCGPVGLIVCETGWFSQGTSDDLADCEDDARYENCSRKAHAGKDGACASGEEGAYAYGEKAVGVSEGRASRGIAFSAATGDRRLYRRLLLPCGKARDRSDGAVHNDRQEYDAERDGIIQAPGIRVLRVTTIDVERDIQSVLQRIQNEARRDD